MPWLSLSYSLPKGPSSRRVALWRRLRRLGALQGPGGLNLLPDRPECLEGLQWLAEEIRQGAGEALVARGERTAGLADAELTRRFTAARDADWALLEHRLGALERAAGRAGKAPSREAIEGIRRLRREHAEVARIDFFPSGKGAALAGRLDRLERALSGPAPGARGEASPHLALSAYRGGRWVTRPRPHVDRLACVWLIRRFIDPKARIRYADRARRGEISFDMPGADFGHGAAHSSFEALRAAFGLDEPALEVLASIVGAIDLGEPLTHPAAEGVAAILDGWRRGEWTDVELERHGVALYEGLYRSLSLGSARPVRKRRRPT